VEHAEPLKLLEDSKNRFEYIIPANTSKGKISTQDLYFTPSVSGNTVVFRAVVDDNTYLEQKYVLGGDYDLDYEVQLKGLGQILNPNAKGVQLNFENYLDKLEKNFTYEVSYSYLRFRENDETPDYIATTGQASKELKSKPVQWIATANQFFNTAIISQNGGFSGAQLYNEAYDDQSDDLKKMIARLDLPANNGEVSHKMKLFVGPNDYNLLKAYGLKLEDIVDYGGSILGTINRWVIRPIFDFLHGFVGNVAICILLLTFIVKAILYPLSYKMIKSQAKTTALKPDIDKLKAKYKDDQQKIQMEQMKLYQEFGVNPLGGCLPTLLQMPIWMALFRFFPASIDFRQKGFLWATDLTGFEEFIKLPFHIPLYGGHISLFALLWGVSLVAFTWYSMKDVDMSGQPAAMKWIQYFTPVIFTIMFNSYAAGLSLYMLFSNILNIGQTIVTKNYIIDHEKIRADLDAYKKKPKKESLFRQKLNEAMQQSQAMREQQEKMKNKKK
jgi:YidC/Oxa1 family membrane protein insertase